MPCSDGGPSYGEELRDTQAKVDKLTRLLCATSRKLRGDELDEDQKLALAESEVWLLKHDKEDARRKAREERAQKQEALRQAAWDKLTPEERRALRLDRTS